MKIKKINHISPIKTWITMEKSWKRSRISNKRKFQIVNHRAKFRATKCKIRLKKKSPKKNLILRNWLNTKIFQSRITVMLMINALVMLTCARSFMLKICLYPISWRIKLIPKYIIPHPVFWICTWWATTWIWSQGTKSSTRSSRTSWEITKENLSRWKRTRSLDN